MQNTAYINRIFGWVVSFFIDTTIIQIKRCHRLSNHIAHVQKPWAIPPELDKSGLNAGHESVDPPTVYATC